MGGKYFVLIAPAGPCVGDAILNVCRRHWAGHETCFQDVQDEAVHSSSDPWVWTRGTSLLEFFVYQDRRAVEAWADGPDKNNRNTMLHFLIGKPLPDRPDTLEIGVVCDRLDAPMKRFLSTLQDAFNDLQTLARSQHREAA